MSGDLRFSLLGPVRAWRGHDELKLGSPQQRLVLAALVLAEGRVVGREQLIDALWGERQPRSALRTLRTYISRLRALLGSDAIVSIGDGYMLRSSSSDLADFEDLCTADEPAQALELWQGEALSGLEGPYAETQRTRLTELRLAVLERCLTGEVENGSHAEAVAELTGLCAAYPLRERLRGLLMLALYKCGRQAEAIGVFTDARRLLDEELGVDPSAELADLYQRIITADPAITPAAPLLPAMDEAVSRPAQLPADLADFTGRSALVAEMSSALSPGAALAISAVAGIGGIGKTALAVHVGHRVRESFPDGQLYIDLRGTGPDPVTPELALGSFLRSLGVADAAIPESLEELAALYRSTLANRRIFVLLDNALGSAQVRPLLPGVSSCAVVVTSRVKLPDLATARLVDLDVLDPGEGLALFTKIVGAERVAAERAAAMDVVGACGFLPLAIRIAASRLAARSGWTIARLRDRLADEQRRLAELRVGDLAVEATFALGYDQLADDQARAFRLLALPDGPDLSLPAAAAVLDLDEFDAEDLCESLVDLNLLESPSPGRYRYHDLLRVFARSRCDAEGQDALHRLTDFYLATARNVYANTSPGSVVAEHLAPTVRPGLSFASQAEAVDWLFAEASGLVATVHQSARGPRDTLVLTADLLYAMEDLTESIGLIPYVKATSARSYFKAATTVIDASRGYGEHRSEGRAWIMLGRLHYVTQRLDQASAAASAGVKLSRRSGDKRFVGEGLQMLASILDGRREHDQALTYYDEALDMLRAVGDLHGELVTLGNKSRALIALDRTAEALTCAERAVAADRKLGMSMTSSTLYQLGIVQRGAGLWTESITSLSEALALYRDNNRRLWEGLALFRLAETYAEIGSSDEAVRHAEQSLGVLREVGLEWGQGMALTVLGRALRQLGQADRARGCWQEALVLFEQLGVPEATDVRTLLSPAPV
ncbi:BTAD domain-containing putative transcriptional regulator [Streptosporangium sp. NPDC000396]|uniref:AfsR/SARP family transcriptional regulator n=1 Tax=Streptosporangium sp. NPDC000396 TaxID=3366185 RepID=UPI0036BF6ACA